MGNCFCLPFQKPAGEICSDQKAKIKRPVAGKFSRPVLETDSQSHSTSPGHKRQMGPAISSEALNSGIKKVRLLVTKQELRDLLSEAMSVEEMLGGAHREGRFRVDFVQRWQPLLETIPERSE